MKMIILKAFRITYIFICTKIIPKISICDVFLCSFNELNFFPNIFFLIVSKKKYSVVAVSFCGSKGFVLVYGSGATYS